ncbi:Lysosomal cobalamin transporter ABCD4, partial [Geodia barretti]
WLVNLSHPERIFFARFFKVEYNIYLAGLIPSQFIYVLDTRDMSGFKRALWMSTVTVISVSICKSAGLLVSGLLYVRGRGLIVRRLHQLYFRGINYYHINVTDHSIDNPDQRMTQDVDKFCDQMTQVLPNVILSPAIIAYYTYKTFQSMGYLGPLCIYAYFVASSVVNKLLVSSIAPMVVRQEKLEGDFRYHHTQVRSNAESIAFYRGGKIEAEKSNGLLKALLQTQLSVVHWQFPLNFSTGIFDYTAAIISYCLVGISIFTEDYDNLSVSELSAAISKNAFFSMYLLNNFSTVVDTAVKFSEIVGYTHRIGELMEYLDKVRLAGDGKSCRLDTRSSNDAINPDPSINSQESVPASSDLGRNQVLSPNTVAPDNDVGLELKNLSIAPPHQSTPLIEGLNMKLFRGKNILVLGDSGCGKSSILRVLRGLWMPLRGCASITCEDSPRSILFLPQKCPTSPPALSVIRSRFQRSLNG